MSITLKDENGVERVWEDEIVILEKAERAGMVFNEGAISEAIREVRTFHGLPNYRWYNVPVVIRVYNDGELTSEELLNRVHQIIEAA